MALNALHGIVNGPFLYVDVVTFGYGNVEVSRCQYTSVTAVALISFSITAPERLKSALLKGRSVTIKTPSATVSNQHHEDRIEWEKLVIESTVKQAVK